MKRPRIIPFLSVQNGYLVKTTNFSNPKYIGDPINAVKIFNEKEVDELVLLDIGGSREDKEPDYELINDITSEAFMPIGYGGGISNLAQIEKLFRSGVEKISLNSILYSNPQIVEEASRTFGSQSVTVSVDFKRNFLGRYSVYSHGGKQKQKIDPTDHILRLEALGAGELVLNSIDRDGTMNGYDLSFIRSIAERVSIPTICLGGAGKAVLISYTDPLTTFDYL
jgi:cyclase